MRTEALDFLNLPLQVKNGFVGSIILKVHVSLISITQQIPWKHLGSEPTKVYIEDVFVIACPMSELRFDEEKVQQ